MKAIGSDESLDPAKFVAVAECHAAVEKVLVKTLLSLGFVRTWLCYPEEINKLLYELLALRVAKQIGFLLEKPHGRLPSPDKVVGWLESAGYALQEVPDRVRNRNL